jgi:hypothetical protein
VHSDLAAEVAALALPHAQQLMGVSAASERSYLLELVARVWRRRRVAETVSRRYSIAMEFIIVVVGKFNVYQRLRDHANCFSTSITRTS